MSYYIDKKSTFLRQFGEVIDKLRSEIGAASATSAKTVSSYENVKNQNIRNAETKRDESLKRIDTARQDSLDKSRKYYNNELATSKISYEKRLQEAQNAYENNVKNENDRLETELNQFYANATKSIITMPPYLSNKSNIYVAPVLNAAPTLQQIQAQAARRTYLPCVLTGMQKVSDGQRTCILPAFADWQTMDNKTTGEAGNLMVIYDSNTIQIKERNMVDGMIYRMLMAFPVGDLRVSVIDPMQKNIQDITQRMNNCEELYNKKVYTETKEINQHLKMLIDKIAPTKREFSRDTLSLVQHNRNGMKHGYELVILYDPFNNRPSYAESLRLLMSSGISAGIYVMIIQSAQMDTNVLQHQEFGFDSFSTVILANEQNFTMLKHHIQWDDRNRTFTGDEKLECNYLPSASDNSPLINPLDVTVENGLVTQFFNSITTDWVNHTKSLTALDWGRWKEPYSEADEECWTKGIEVPIGINEDTKEDMFFRVQGTSNTYAHAFIQGMTGSGKSKLLCTTISSIAMKYSPRAVEMYLFDFKDGAAFRRYEGVPHMRWLVTTQADKMMFLSVLRELQKEKEKRMEIISSMGENNLEGYNKKMISSNRKEKCLSRILLVVDECQKIYETNGDYDKQKEINQIFNDVAKQYRSAGIHLLLASQSIPDNLGIDQFNNNYILYVGKAHFSSLLPPDSAQADDIQKRITAMPPTTGVYSSVDNAYISMYAYDTATNAGEEIKKRAETQLGKETYMSFVDKSKTWNGKLDVPYLKFPVQWYMEFGANTIGSETIGTLLDNMDSHSNVLLYGALGGDAAQQLTMRTVLTTLRGVIYTRTQVDKEDWPEVYLASAWRTVNTVNRWGVKQTNPLEQSQKILDNLAQHNYIHLVNNEQLEEVLLKLHQQIKNKRRRNVLLYIIGANSMDLFTKDNPLHIEQGSSTSQEEKTDQWRNYAKTKMPSSFAGKDETLTGKKALAFILREGAQYDIHTVLHIGETEEMEQLGVEVTDFQYFIFQQATHFNYWSGKDSKKLALNINLKDNLSVNQESARTLFYDSVKPDDEQFIVPFMLDELSEAELRGEDVGEFILENTKNYAG